MKNEALTLWSSSTSYFLCEELGPFNMEKWKNCWVREKNEEIVRRSTMKKGIEKDVSEMSVERVFFFRYVIVHKLSQNNK